MHALAAGGNAFDAVLAALMAACVAEPVLASPGGGGFILALPAGGEPRLYDAFVHTPRVRRPQAEANAREVITDWGTAQQAFHIGVGCAATPGLVAGMFAVHRELARLPMPVIAAPAVQAARDGIAVSPFMAYLMTLVAPIYLELPAARAIFGDPAAVEGGAPTPVKAGGRLVNPVLGDMLEQLAREGEDLFYRGDVAAAIVRQSREAGGHITADDLAAYRVKARAPLRLRYRDATLLTNPPPAAGGLMIAFALALLSGHALKDMGFHTAEHAALLARVQAETVRARATAGPPREGVEATWLGGDLLAAHAAALAGPLRSRGTTHVSVIDAAGNAASATVSNGEGCGEIVPGTGMMLNNMLGEDDVNPPGPHAWPLDQRLASMMSPTAIVGDDGGLLVCGSGGSKRIRTAVLQVVSNVLDFGLPLPAAIAAPRIHVEGDHVSFEAGLSPAAAELLAGLFDRTTAWPGLNMFFGGVHTVQRAKDGRLSGFGDPRRDGVCLGGE
ncbi:gamma-glutamyltransferase family protein [Nannocystis pusilla]|uniref:gamma-glutamyltransferase family protein n=1 Tax=Nannocystis pusilla TaxID=889268 RepID=UPI003BF0F76D